ncbi:MAG: MBOAT family protein [Candidatus Rokubacteria bacterium]|nr:MBOAT family protein [Candidatus Rokubacteria bacterium]
MSFNSLEFLVFFPIAVAAYFALPQKARWAWLLSASCAFYMFFRPVYILILAFTILVDYAAGIWMEDAPGRASRGRLLALSILANVGVLAFFKYYNFANENLTGLAALFGRRNPIPYLNILLPIGLSFHTFQAMSYTIEVYRGKQKAERHLGIYALYVMFFPQLVAGPIERPQNLLHQFHEEHELDFARAAEGLRLMLWGFFKKVVIADRAALLVNRVVDSPAEHNGLTLLIAVYFFAFQIYCDFSGYSDIAVGAARIMGIDLMRNFDRPYVSRSASEFWRRWHLSLSTWFRDYLFTPLWRSTREWGIAALVGSLFATFLVSGLWHGANWTFVAWGGYHGVLLILNRMFEPWWGRVPMLLRRGVTFLLVTIGWVFFRSDSLTTATDWMKKMIGVGVGSVTAPEALILWVIGALIIVNTVPETWDIRFGLTPRWAAIYGAAFFLAYLFMNEKRTVFLYYQF